ncbi:MAG TPA: hypothetical protein DCL00_02005 [Opitutae bacterium]|nr:hypothetical protein [Opitutae bacterium]HAF58341.1 hypothetical protein [Opitutae bacterium]
MTKFVTRTFLYLAVFISSLQAEDRIPFYEEFIESGDLAGYLEIANQYLDENPEAKEAPRLALDLMMMGKAAEDLDSIVRGTDLLLFQYLGSLPSLHFISSFDKGSPRLTQLLRMKLNEADLSDQNFSNSFADSLVLLARIHGPELLHDPSLLLGSYLITQKSNNQDLLQSLSKALDITEEKNQKFSPLVRICRSDNPPLQKISQLQELSMIDTEFFIKFFMAQLTSEEKNSPAFLESMINSTLFGVPTRPELALSYLSSLPDHFSTLPKFQVSTALAHLLGGNSESALTVLKSIPTPSQNAQDPWLEIAQSLLDGIEFGSSRKSLFLEQLSSLYDRWQRETDAFLIEGSWNDQDPPNSFNFQIGVNNESKMFEIQIFQGKNPVFAYRVDPNQCLILSPSGKNIKFENGGAYPMPLMEIKRDTQGGAFNYSFNLNFAKEFEDFASQISENLNISYIGTPKGREVLLNHFFERKTMWLDPPASSDRGTLFTLNKVDPSTVSQNYKVEISASGELISLHFGKLRISKFSQGSPEILGSLPKWSDQPAQSTEQDFKLPVLLESIGALMNQASTQK